MNMQVFTVVLVAASLWQARASYDCTDYELKFSLPNGNMIKCVNVTPWQCKKFWIVRKRCPDTCVTDKEWKFKLPNNVVKTCDQIGVGDCKKFEIARKTCPQTCGPCGKCKDIADKVPLYSGKEKLCIDMTQQHCQNWTVKASCKHTCNYCNTNPPKGKNVRANEW